uniref:Uncharacterized protein n=1 Tax=Siphoviridae sp. ctxfQ4 TaxID=2826521 RepID=A0A8S5N5E5_9CAUD|nr:MAG TPA: hypothetical protein [Siphoviridae sp. ctxfQ4]
MRLSDRLIVIPRAEKINRKPDLKRSYFFRKESKLWQ